MKEEERIEYIQNYIEGLLDSEEMKKFEEKISSNSSFALEFKMQKQLTSHFNNESEMIKNELNSETFRTFIRSDEGKKARKLITEGTLRYRYTVQKKTKSSVSKSFYKIAATIILIASLGVIIVYSNQPISGQDLYEDYYSSQDLPNLIQRSSGVSYLDKGITRFKNKEYKQAIIEFEQHRATVAKIDPSVLLYEGIALLELNKIDAAHNKFDKFIHLNTIDSPKGHWFKGLTYLKQGDKKAALDSFKLLSELNTRYKLNEISAILEKLEY